MIFEYWVNLGQIDLDQIHLGQRDQHSRGDRHSQSSLGRINLIQNDLGQGDQNDQSDHHSQGNHHGRGIHTQTICIIVEVSFDIKYMVTVAMKHAIVSKRTLGLVMLATV